MPRVLLVDDHPMIGAALEMLLRESDYELIGRAKTAAEATKQINTQKPDLVLLDVHLLDASGLDVLRRLRRPACYAFEFGVVRIDLPIRRKPSHRRDIFDAGDGAQTTDQVCLELRATRSGGIGRCR